MKTKFWFVMRLMGFQVSKANKEYNRIQGRINHDLEAYHDQSVKSIVEYHIKNNDFYRNLVGDSNKGNGSLPIITKQDLQGDARLKLPLGKTKYYWSKTSGSSGTPLAIAKDKYSHALIWKNVENIYVKAGVQLDDLQARFYGAPRKGVAKVKERIKDVIANRERFVIFNVEDRVLEQWIKRFEKKHFIYLYGYTNAIVVFAKYLSKQGIVLKNICPTLKACIITSEMCSDEDLQYLKKGLGIAVFNEYGASELGVIGFRKDHLWEVSDATVYLEVVDENGQTVEDGTLGRLLCTLLHNKGTPLIRYEIGDLAAIKREQKKTLITQLVGRSSDLVELPSGKKVPGLTFYYVAKDLLKNVSNIREFRIVQTAETAFDLEIVTEDGSIDKGLVLGLINKGFNEYLEEGLEVQVNLVKQILRTGNGKFKHFIALK